TWSVVFSTRTAETLYSGIFESGSSARLVSWLAACRPGQWYGMNTVSGRMVSTTRAGSVIETRRDVTRTAWLVMTPSESARRGRGSHMGAGYCATSGAVWRFWGPDRYCEPTRPVVSHSG